MRRFPVEPAVLPWGSKERENGYSSGETDSFGGSAQVKSPRLLAPVNSSKPPEWEVVSRVIPVVLPKVREPLVQTMVRPYGGANSSQREDEDEHREAP